MNADNLIRQRMMKVFDDMKECLPKHLDHSLVCYDISRNDYYGVVIGKKRLFHFHESKLTRLIVCNIEDYSMCVYELNGLVPRVYMNQHEVVTILPLDAKGSRWGGSMLNNQPFGYGIVYDEKNRVKFVGFVYQGKRVCLGKELNCDNNKELYFGYYYENTLHGYGTLYNRNGTAIHKGLWKHGIAVSLYHEFNTIDSSMETVFLPNASSYETTTFSLRDWFPKLKQISIGDGCLYTARVFELSALPNLESVVVGAKTCTYAMNQNNIQEATPTDGTCRIVNCPKLQSIRFGDFSFSDYRSFELTQLPSLESIEMSGYGFYWTPVFSLTGLLSFSSSQKTFHSCNHSS